MTNNNTPQQKMRVKHIVQEFPISRATVWLYVKQGKFNATKITKGVTVFDRTEIEAFFNGNLQAIA